MGGRYLQKNPLINQYYKLTKPGIIRGNMLSTIAGFILASAGHFNIYLFAATIFGIAMVIASGCVLNNIIDRNLDKKMDRTKKRAIVTGSISVKNAAIYGTIVGLLGFGSLYLYTNLITVFAAAVGFVFYVVVYGYFKRASVYGTLVGSISGAIPPVVGYLAVSNQFDMGAFLLFLILVMWQMPHFYAIAIYRLSDYSNASLPVLPVKKGIKVAQIHILLYIVGFIAASALLSFYQFTGTLYLISISILGLFWLGYGLKGFRSMDNVIWAKKMFGFSLLVLLAVCIMMSVDVVM